MSESTEEKGSPWFPLECRPKPFTGPDDREEHRKIWRPKIDELRTELTQKLNLIKRVLYVVNQDKFRKALENAGYVQEYKMAADMVRSLDHQGLKKWMVSILPVNLKTASRRKKEALAKEMNIRGYRRMSDKELDSKLSERY